MISMVPLVPWNLIGSPPALFRLQRSTTRNFGKS